MGISDAVKSCFEKYATFAGRAPRSEYWWYILFEIISYFIIGLLFATIGYLCGDIGGALIAVGIGITFFAIATFLPSLAVKVRRLHDTGHSGFWYFINCVPIIGGIWFLILMIMSSDEENEYGLPIY